MGNGPVIGVPNGSGEVSQFSLYMGIKMNFVSFATKKVLLIINNVQHFKVLTACCLTMFLHKQ